MDLLVCYRFVAALVAMCLGITLAPLRLAPVAAASEPGAVAYAAKCAICHGSRGEGVADKYEEPLQGELSIADLAVVIEETMPHEMPETCVGEEAHQIAAYIHGAFYSPQALHAEAPRVELARLTVPQFRNAVADLLANFTPRPESERAVDKPVARGLSAEYFQSKGMSKADQLKQQRIDDKVDFDFGEGGPGSEIDASQFAIVWTGSLVTDNTGYHEFRITTPNGVRLYLNNDPLPNRRGLRDDSSVAGQAALIDGWVSSAGMMREHTARVFLLGDRTYPLRLEFFKYKETTAAVRLEWKPPYGTWSILDNSHLVADSSARTFVVDTPFPADDRSLGYERGSSVSRAWQEATTTAAIATAAEVVDRLPLLGDFAADAADPDKQIRDFILRFAAMAFRRPLFEAEQTLLAEQIFDESPTVDAAVRRAVVLVLTSPHFLYTDLMPPGEPPSQHAIAARLALALWDSIPDEQLREAAADGQLASQEQIEAQARRMISDPRARAKMRCFFQHWLELDERDLAKDSTLFPEFDEEVVADLRRSLELFVNQVLWSDASDYRELLLADYLLLNDRLASLYGSQRAEESSAIDPPHEEIPTRPDEFQRVAVSPEERCGVLTHPYLLSAFAYHNSTSPIHRGVFLTRNIVGRHLNPPPVAVSFNNEEFPPDLTMREKITQLTRDKACMSCHSIINPLGFALESYDSIGRRLLTNDDNQPLDTKSQYTTSDGRSLEIEGPRDIANFAVTSPSASRAFVIEVFHHLTKQNPNAYGLQALDGVHDEFADNGYSIRNLCVAIASLFAGDGLTATVPNPQESEP